MTNHFVECTYLIFLLLKKLFCFCSADGFSSQRCMKPCPACFQIKADFCACSVFIPCVQDSEGWYSQNMSCSPACNSSGGPCSPGGHSHFILAPSALWSHIKLSDPVIQRLPDLAAVISLTCKILPLRGAWFWLPSLAELSTWLPHPLKSSAEVF